MAISVQERKTAYEGAIQYYTEKLNAQQSNHVQGICVILGNLHYEDRGGYMLAPWYGWWDCINYFPELKNFSQPYSMKATTEGINERLKILRNALNILENNS